MERCGLTVTALSGREAWVGQLPTGSCGWRRGWTACPPGRGGFDGRSETIEPVGISPLGGVCPYMWDGVGPGVDSLRNITCFLLYRAREGKQTRHNIPQQGTPDGGGSRALWLALAADTGAGEARQGIARPFCAARLRGLGGRRRGGERCPPPPPPAAPCGRVSVAGAADTPPLAQPTQRLDPPRRRY